jgi:hypothetical protein
MVASALLRVEPIDTSVPGWAEFLPSDVGGAFEEYLRRLPNERREGAMWLLTALAFSEGHGLPRKVWLPVARRLSELPLREADIDALLEENGSYLSIVEAIGGKHFRLYHQELTDHLRRRMLRRWDLRDVAERFVDTLLDLAPDHDWSRAHSYVRGHLATHAAAAGTIERFVADPSFVLAAEPAGLLRAVRHVRQAPALALSVERYVDILGDAAPQTTDQAARLAFVAESNGAAELARRAEKLSPSVQQIRIESRLVTPHRIVGRHEEVSYSTTSFSGSWLIKDATLSDGGRVVVAVLRQEPHLRTPGERAPHVHVWALDDPSSSTILPHPTAVVGLALPPTGQGQTLAVTLDRVGDLRVWDLAEHTVVQHVPDTGYQEILDTGKLADGTPVVVCSDGRRVVVHDPLGGPVFEVECATPTGPAARGWVTARLVSLKAGEPALVVCDGARGTVTRCQLGIPDTRSVLLEGLDRPVLLAETLQGENTATVVIWETHHTRKEAKRLFLLDCGSGKTCSSEHDGTGRWPRGGFVSADGTDDIYVMTGPRRAIQIQSTTTGRLDTAIPKAATDFFVPIPTPLLGRAHAIVGDIIGGIQVLDCVTGMTVSAPMRGHEGAVRAVRLLGSAEPEGLDVLTVGNDGTARLWHWQHAEGDWRQARMAAESERSSVFAKAYTQAMYGWEARPDVVVASSWGGFRLVDATVLDHANAEQAELTAWELLSVHNAVEDWAEDPNGTVNLLVKSEQIVDAEGESRTRASFSWNRITTMGAVSCTELNRLTMVSWATDCHLVPASALHPRVRMVGYCPVSGQLHTVGSCNAETETMRSWWSVDPARNMVYSAAFTARTGHAVLMVGVRRAAVAGDFTISHHYVNADEAGIAARPARASSSPHGPGA